MVGDGKLPFSFTACRLFPGRKRRMHGGNSPGPPKGSKNAWKHGRRSAEYLEQKRQAQEITKRLRMLMDMAIAEVD